MQAGDLPRMSRRQIEAWLNPFERCQRQCNSLAWLTRETQRQQENGWPGIPPADLT